MSHSRIDPAIDPCLNPSEIPVYLDHCVIWQGNEYRIYLDGNEQRDFLNLPAALELEPGEVPRHVLEGFVYGKRVFLPLEMRGLGFDERCRSLVKEMLAIDAGHRRAKAQGRTIPAELEGVVVELAGKFTLRAIADAISNTTGQTYTFGSVDRVVRRRRREACLATLGQELEDDFRKSRADFESAAERMMDQQLELLERGEGDPAFPQLLSMLRASQHTASLLERRLRGATRQLVQHTPSSGRPAAAEPLRPVMEAEPAPPDSTASEPPPSPPPPMESEDPYERSRLHGLEIKRQLGLVPALLLAGWLLLHGTGALAAPIFANPIVPLYGLYGSIGAVIANSPSAIGRAEPTPSVPPAARSSGGVTSSLRRRVSKRRELTLCAHTGTVAPLGRGREVGTLLRAPKSGTKRAGFTVPPR